MGWVEPGHLISRSRGVFCSFEAGLKWCKVGHIMFLNHGRLESRAYFVLKSMFVLISCTQDFIQTEMAAALASCHLRFILHSQPLSASPSSLISFFGPLLVSSSNAQSMPLQHWHVPRLRKTLFSSLISTSSFSFSVSQDGGETETFDGELETERGDFEDTQLDSHPTLSPLESKREERLKLELPNLSVKERKELASYAHSLGKKLKTQLVGKFGVTSNVATSFIETLEANELLKIKIHRSCPGELDDVVKQLEEATGSVTVGQIGRTLIIYRPSLSKLKAEEKKKQVRKLFLKKQLNPRMVKKSNGQAPKLSRRGSSWKARHGRS
ncbi:hypothetical protein VNO77_36073 [Canavalia gladiata]|uniref:CRM domain-containing protein n=1 Tax=Canavalia gladiata TaxID=3824 RepID=A0AAN9PU47_CANGL